MKDKIIIIHWPRSYGKAEMIRNIEEFAQQGFTTEELSEALERFAVVVKRNAKSFEDLGKILTDIKKQPITEAPRSVIPPGYYKKKFK